MSAAGKRVLVAGAGDLGLGLAARLVAADVDVATLNRSGRSINGATIIRADLSDPATLARLPEFDLVVFTTAPPGRDEAAYRIAYIDGPRHLMAALPAEPARVVLTSTTGVYGVDDGSWVDEETAIEPCRPTAAVVAEGETRLRDLAHTTVLRPAGIYGPGRETLLAKVRSGEAAVASNDSPRWTNRVHRDDVVTALYTLLTHPDPPPAAIAVDDEPAPRDEVIRWLAARLDAPAPPTMQVKRESGKRLTNTLLRSLGWAPLYATFREGYASLLG